MMIPEFSNISNWANSIIIDFPNDDIPLLYNEDDWKAWGNSLVQSTTFAQNNAPSTQRYDDWQTWAKDLYYCMNNN